MKYLIPKINLQHDNGCPLKTNEVSLPHEASESIMSVNELIHENYSKVIAEPKYCGLWASQLHVSTFFIVISWSNAYYY